MMMDNLYYVKTAIINVEIVVYLLVIVQLAKEIEALV